jgi:hypothetical protein
MEVEVFCGGIWKPVTDFRVNFLSEGMPKILLVCIMAGDAILMREWNVNPKVRRKASVVAIHVED